MPRFRIPARFGGIVLPFLLSICMTGIISGVSTLMTLGVSRFALQAWPAIWFSSWIVAFPALLVVLPFVRRLSAAIVAPAEPKEFR